MAIIIRNFMPFFQDSCEQHAQTTLNLWKWREQKKVKPKLWSRPNQLCHHTNTYGRRNLGNLFDFLTYWSKLWEKITSWSSNSGSETKLDQHSQKPHKRKTHANEPQSVHGWSCVRKYAWRCRSRQYISSLFESIGAIQIKSTKNQNAYRLFLKQKQVLIRLPRLKNQHPGWNPEFF